MKKAIIILNILLTVLTCRVSGQVLDVPTVSQEQNQWCWVGVSSCVLGYYDNNVPQCEIAEYTRTVEIFPDVHFGNVNCCTTPASCNNWNYNWGGPGSIEDILVHFAGIPNNKIGSSITLANISTNIADHRPFIIRWGWASGGGHFVVGYGISGENLYYMDPWPGEGKKIATYNWVKTDSIHTWTHTNTFGISPQLPAKTGPISGKTGITVCNGPATETYSVELVDRATKYLWTLPEGATGSSTTNSILVTFSMAAVSGMISVAGQNNAGNGPLSSLSLVINPLPEDAGKIDGKPIVCQRERNVTYTVPEINFSSSYLWTHNLDAAGTSTTNSLTLNFGFKISNGTLSVKGKNDCGEGKEYSFEIKISGIPETPTIKQQGNTLTSSSPIGNQWYNSSEPIDGATSQSYTITSSGDYYVIVTIDGCISDPSETLSLILNGIENESCLKRLTIYPNPATDKLIIDSGGTLEPILFAIVNTLGEALIESILINRATIDLNGLPSGVYLVKFQTGKEISVKKFLKNQ
ncbi:MAG: T9SS type A sorting domain-containing protein [Bacteroidales bacterium]|jgi:hypothetical protein